MRSSFVTFINTGTDQSGPRPGLLSSLQKQNSLVPIRRIPGETPVTIASHNEHGMP